jgi:FixJ family two-component response regulator
MIDADHPVGRRNSGPGTGLLDRLSSREREVLDGVVRGFTNKEIGQELKISHRTVEIHRARLMRKLGATTIAGLISIALKCRWVNGYSLTHGSE